MAAPIIQSVGTISGAGTPGVGRKDLVIGETVTLSDTEVQNTIYPHSWAFQDVPPGSTAVLNGPATATPTFIPDVTGSYRIQASVTDATSVQRSTIVVAVPLASSRVRMPSFEERREYNGAGNTKGWHPAMVEFMRAMDTLVRVPTPLYNPELIADSSGSEVVALTFSIPFDYYPWTNLRIRVLAQALSASGTAVVRLRVGGTGPTVADGTVIATQNVTSAVLAAIDFSGTLANPNAAQVVKVTLQSSGAAAEAQVGVATLTARIA